MLTLGAGKARAIHGFLGEGLGWKVKKGDLEGKEGTRPPRGGMPYLRASPVPATDIYLMRLELV